MRPGCSCQSRSRKVGQAVGWIVPGIVLAVMPKCPLCLAAYIALFTGIGISLAVAKFAWWLVVIICVGILAYLGIMAVRRFIEFK
jgi:hypothetical protein